MLLLLRSDEAGQMRCDDPKVKTNGLLLKQLELTYGLMADIPLNPIWQRDKAH